MTTFNTPLPLSFSTTTTPCSEDTLEPIPSPPEAKSPYVSPVLGPSPLDSTKDMMEELSELDFALSDDDKESSTSTSGEDRGVEERCTDTLLSNSKLTPPTSRSRGRARGELERQPSTVPEPHPRAYFILLQSHLLVGARDGQPSLRPRLPFPDLPLPAAPYIRRAVHLPHSAAEGKERGRQA